MIVRNINHIIKTGTRKLYFSDASSLSFRRNAFREAKTLSELLKGPQFILEDKDEDPLYRQFMRKFTILLNKKQIQESSQTKAKVQNIIYKIRRLTSAELHSTSTDILNYIHLFHKLFLIFPRYHPEGFEIRTIMLSSQLPCILPTEEKQLLAISLTYYMISKIQKLTNEFRKNFLTYLIRRFVVKIKEKKKLQKNDFYSSMIIHAAFNLSHSHLDSDSFIFVNSLQTYKNYWHSVKEFMIPSSKRTNQQLVMLLQSFVSTLKMDQNSLLRIDYPYYQTIYGLLEQVHKLVKHQSQLLKPNACFYVGQALIITTLDIDEDIKMDILKRLWNRVRQCQLSSQKYIQFSLKYIGIMNYNILDNVKGKKQLYRILHKITLLQTNHKIRLLFVNLINKKKDLLQPKQCKQLIMNLLKRDSNSDYWEIYYLLAQLKNQNLIPFDGICKRIISMIKVSQTQKSAYYYEEQAIKLYGLLRLIEKQQVLKKTNEIISFQDLQSLFFKWMNVYIYKKKSKKDDNSPETQINYSVELSDRFYEKQTYQNIYKCLFVETGCYEQPQIFKAILNHPFFHKLICMREKDSNFPFIFMFLILAIKDNPELAQNYPCQDILTMNNIRKNRLFQLLQKFLIPQCLVRPHQWQYILNIMKAQGCVKQGKFIFIQWIQKSKSYNFSTNYQIPSKQQFQIKRMILLQLINELYLNSENPFVNSKHLSYLLRMMLTFGIRPNKNQYFTPQFMENLKQKILNLPLHYGKETSMSIGKMFELGLLDKQFASRLFKILKLQKNQFGNVLLINYLFPKNSEIFFQAQRMVFFMYDTEEKMHGQYYWLILCIKYMHIRELAKIQKAIKKILNPNHRNHLIQLYEEQINKEQEFIKQRKALQKQYVQGEPIQTGQHQQKHIFKGLFKSKNDSK